MTSYSQFGEDFWILKHLPLPPKGVFCEVGAYDGLASSNTKGFEEEGWTGVCIEPDPHLAALCRRNRSVETINCAIGTGSVTQEFHINIKDRGTSGLRRPETNQKILVWVQPLHSALFMATIPHEFELLSIDTEGSELEVWSTRGPYVPRIVIVEFLTWGSPPRDKEIVARMTQDGYTEVHRTEANLIFTRRV